jgi:hypothetical protein
MRDCRIEIGNNNNYEDIDDIVNLDEAFDKYQHYAEPVSNPIDILLPSQKSKLEHLKIT